MCHHKFISSIDHIRPFANPEIPDMDGWGVWVRVSVPVWCGNNLIVCRRQPEAPFVTWPWRPVSVALVHVPFSYCLPLILDSHLQDSAAPHQRYIPHWLTIRWTGKIWRITISSAQTIPIELRQMTNMHNLPINYTVIIVALLGRRKQDNNRELGVCSWRQDDIHKQPDGTGT